MNKLVERVAKTICRRNGHEPSVIIPSTRRGMKSQEIIHYWHNFEGDARAEIIAVLDGLLVLDLPLSALDAAEEAQKNGLASQEPTFIPEQDSFRAICADLAASIKETP